MTSKPWLSDKATFAIMDERGNPAPRPARDKWELTISWCPWRAEKSESPTTEVSKWVSHCTVTAFFFSKWQAPQCWCRRGFHFSGFGRLKGHWYGKLGPDGCKHNSIVQIWWFSNFLINESSYLYNRTPHDLHGRREVSMKTSVYEDKSLFERFSWSLVGLNCCNISSAVRQ